MERDTIDNYAKNHPATTFINASPGGLGFKHIPYMSFQEISKTYLPISSDYNKKVRELMEQTKITVSDVETILATLRSSLERCLALFQLLQQEKEGSGKSVLYQSDLETEIAYQLVLGASKRALERWGQKKDPLALEQEKWKFLEEAARSYLDSI
jgi:hypothetical protein